MYTVTFYSFKGGVGRTMALVNVAASLAAKGRRVLVVDFDLEAPGASTYGLFKGQGDLGVVDYVEYYRKHGEAPAVSDYVRRCELPEGSGELWIMPAGRQDSRYAARLNSIDWLRLYTEEDGFLMFEDLKAQWHQHLNPDYVLIDSRTGHTDVGGICTRQLPDAVVALFIPNVQNLAGLRTVVESIRRESKPPRNHSIQLHFVPSSVPELDDEEGIAMLALERSRQTLEYDEPAAILHHYGSLSLLNQPIFVLERPRTRLAKEYVELTSAIIRQNVLDREGALAYLQAVENAPTVVGRKVTVQALEDRLRAIASAHAHDSAVLARMAAIRDATGDSESALSLLTAAIESGYRNANAYIRRAKILRSLGRIEEAVTDLQATLEIEGVDFSDLYFAVRALAELSPNSLVSIGDAPALRHLDSHGRMFIAEALKAETLLPVAERLLRSGWAELNASPSGALARLQMTLVLIGQGRFDDAMSSIAPTREDVASSDDISDVFNYAMAEWGKTGHPPSDLFRRVMELDLLRPPKGGANYSQCLAVAAHFAGDDTSALTKLADARQGIEENPISTFSCWRYLDILPSEFEDDLKAIEKLIRGGEVIPKFFTRAR